MIEDTKQKGLRREKGKYATKCMRNYLQKGKKNFALRSRLKLRELTATLRVRSGLRSPGCAIAMSQDRTLPFAPVPFIMLSQVSEAKPGAHPVLWGDQGAERSPHVGLLEIDAKKAGKTEAC